MSFEYKASFDQRMSLMSNPAEDAEKYLRHLGYDATIQFSETPAGVNYVFTDRPVETKDMTELFDKHYVILEEVREAA